MLLAIDSGNTNIVFAVYDGREIRGQWRSSNDPRRTADEYAVWLLQLMRLDGLDNKDVDASIISNVVPAAKFSLKTLCRSYFSSEPLVIGEPNIRFYAGCPLTVFNGNRLGTLCIIDNRPRTLDSEDLQHLRDLARMAEQELVAVQLATMDELTLLSNRRGFETLSQNALSLCRRHDQPASLLFFDLNRFKLKQLVPIKVGAI